MQYKSILYLLTDPGILCNLKWQVSAVLEVTDMTHRLTVNKAAQPLQARRPHLHCHIRH